MEDEKMTIISSTWAMLAWIIPFNRAVRVKGPVGGLAASLASTQQDAG